MKRRTVTFTPEARNDLFGIGDWIAERAGADVALNYIAVIWKPIAKGSNSPGSVVTGETI